MQYVLKTPLSKQDLAPLKAGDTVLLSGVVYTARDAAHARMMELLDKGEPLPFPIEGAAIGNLLAQAMALGEIKDIAELREVVRRSEAVAEFQPHHTPAWEAAYQKLLALAK